jgi:hypothetical protein
MRVTPIAAAVAVCPLAGCTSDPARTASPKPAATGSLPAGYDAYRAGLSRPGVQAGTVR